MDPRLRKLNGGMASTMWKEFDDYKKSNYTLHVKNVRLIVRQEVLAQRQQMQVNQVE